jgi:hypothetical protein
MEAMGEQIAALLARLPPGPDARSGHHAAIGGAGVAATVAPDAPSVWPGAVAAPRFDTPPAHSAYGQAVPAYTPAPPPPSAMHGGPASYASGPPAAIAPAPPGMPTASMVPRHGRSPIVAIAGALVIAAAGLAVVLVMRGASPPTPTDVVVPGPAHPEEHDRPAPPPPAPAVDPWSGAPIDGTKVGIGQGVSLIIPPQFQATVNGELTIAGDGSDVVIFAGPIEIASSDPMELARYHAKRNNLTFDSMKSIVAGGGPRPMLVFHGKLNGVAFRQIAVPLIGPGYRIGVVFQASVHRLDSDHAVQGMALDLFTRRIVLP